jgi:preprotein translocase SecE subunit
MALTFYRPGQGVYARATAGGAAVLLSLFGSWRLFELLKDGSGSPTKILGMNVPASALWAGGAFVLLVLLICLVAFGIRTGVAALDGKVRAFVDLLIDTQTELAKVSWPGKTDLTRSTAAVLISIVVLAAFLFGVDYLLTLAWKLLFF